jgi:ribosomal protein S27AE
MSHSRRCLSCKSLFCDSHHSETQSPFATLAWDCRSRRPCSEDGGVAAGRCEHRHLAANQFGQAPATHRGSALHSPQGAASKSCEANGPELTNTQRRRFWTILDSIYARARRRPWCDHAWIFEARTPSTQPVRRRCGMCGYTEWNQGAENRAHRHIAPKRLGRLVAHDSEHVVEGQLTSGRHFSPSHSVLSLARISHPTLEPQVLAGRHRRS